MTDPGSLPPELARLFADERGAPGASDGDRDAIRHRLSATLGIGVAASAVHASTASATAATTTTASATAATAATSTATATTTALATLVGKLSIVALVVAGGAVLIDTSAAPEVALPTLPGSEIHAPVSPVVDVVATAPDVPARASAPAPTRPRRGSPDHGVGPSDRARSSPPARSTALPEIEPQHAVITRAWSALDRGDARSAFELVEADRRSRPTGSLDEEREVIAIVALTRLDRRSAADVRAARFRTSYPDSIHRSLIEHTLESSP